MFFYYSWKKIETDYYNFVLAALFYVWSLATNRAQTVKTLVSQIKHDGIVAGIFIYY